MFSSPSPSPEVVRGSYGCCSIKGNEGTSTALSLKAVLDIRPAGAGFSPVQSNEPQPQCIWGTVRRSCSHSCVSQHKIPIRPVTGGVSGYQATWDLCCETRLVWSFVSVPEMQVCRRLCPRWTCPFTCSDWQRANSSLCKPNPALNLCAIARDYTTFNFFSMNL